jgi:hypothetical protein
VFRCVVGTCTVRICRFHLALRGEKAMISDSFFVHLDGQDAILNLKLSRGGSSTVVD